MKNFAWVTIGVHWDPSDRYALYYREAIEHAGVPFTRLEALSPAALGELDVLLLCGSGQTTKSVRNSMQSWVEDGGSLVCSGSDWGLAEILGLEAVSSHVSRGKLQPKHGERCWPGGIPEVTFFGGEIPSFSSSARVGLNDKSGGIALSRRTKGRGKAFFFGPHVGQTMCQMQLGRSVEVDGVGASDGSARLDDGVLRAEDGSALDFNLDRERVGEANLFATPFADAVKEIWLRLVVEAVESAKKLVAIPWYWPHNAPGAAVLSIECKTYDEVRIKRVQRSLSLIGCRPAWMVGLPGFALDVYRGFRNWDQEVGLLFSIEDGLSWNEERMKIQHVALGRAAASPSMLSARPEDGKWLGWMNFYEMCEGAGARLSLGKGGRQPGTQGFLFGTAHPFFPLKRDGSSYFVAELPYAAFMPGQTHSLQVSETLIERALAVNGCYHAVLHLEDPAYDDAVDATRRLMSICKQKHMEMLKPEDVYRIEKTRRMLRIYPKANLDQGSLTLVADQDIEGLTMLFVGAPMSMTIHGHPANLSSSVRFGTKVQALTLNLEAKTQVDIAVELAESRKAA